MSTAPHELHASPKAESGFRSFAVAALFLVDAMMIKTILHAISVCRNKLSSMRLWKYRKCFWKSYVKLKRTGVSENSRQARTSGAS
jgi:hypothetical protein